MSQQTPRGAAAIDTAVTLFLRLAEDGGSTPLAEVAREAGVPISTAQRMVAVFVRQGLLSRVARGVYGPGLKLVELSGVRDRRGVLVAVSRPMLRRLSRQLATTVHLGVLEADMVTYLVKERGGGADILTREMAQLEAYCSGIGKVLLAHLPDAARDAYLAAGPFVALTPSTVTEPTVLRARLTEARADGFALDEAEIDAAVFCMAVPVRGPGGAVVAAISASYANPEALDGSLKDRLQGCAGAIGRRLGFAG